VLNHSGEGDRFGPTLSLRGLDNATYYRLVDASLGEYVDDTGCGNTLALDRPTVLRLAMDALRHFARAAGVDGFRFDLGTTLGRSKDGFDAAAPLLQAIAQDPLLRRLKILVEPWDVGPGGYRLGAFPAPWAEWNDRFRDAVRRFWRGTPGAVGEVATRLSGSADFFAGRHRKPSRSINYVAAHDGFTLADLVSYETKHNDANGEHNRDGADVNHSWNHGFEGPSGDPSVIASRTRDVRSLLATLMVARGTPLLSMGDELGRTQRGNNNAYAQDNPLTWIDWTNADRSLVDFVATLCSLRRAHPALHADRWLTGTSVDETGIRDVEWRRADGQPMSAADWDARDRQVLIAALYARASTATAGDRVVLVMNAGAAAVNVNLPPLRTGHGWSKLVDTGSAAAADVSQEPIICDAVLAGARSVLVMAEAKISAPHVRRSADPQDAFARLVAAAGILPDWTDVHGKRHDVGLDTMRALLASMGLAAGSDADAVSRLRELTSARWRGALPATIVVRKAEGIEIPVALSEAALRRKRRLVIEIQGGEERELQVHATSVAVTSSTHGRRRRVRCNLMLPPLPHGVHRLRLEDEGQRSCALIVAPGRCYMPRAVRGGERVFGLAAPLYALRRESDQGIGDFTTLVAAARATAEAGGSIVGINPLHALFMQDRDRASPYHPSDRRFIDPIYIDVERVADFEASREARAVFAANERTVAGLRASDIVDYPSVWRVKRAVLDACFATFDRRPANDPLVTEFDAYVRSRGESLRAFAVFSAMCAMDPGRPWQRWPRGLRRPEAGAAKAFGERHVRDVRLATYMQWHAHRQLRTAAREARDAGLRFGIYGDLAVGAAPDGAEAWANEASLAHGASIGAPPDMFSPSGQVWNLAPDIPHRLGTSGYARFRELLAANMRNFGALRIDHVMGLARLFWVPDGASAREGAYVTYPLDDLLGALALESHSAHCMVVGEDLGTVPEGLRDRLAAEDILSYRVLWFERDAAGYSAPDRYPAKAAACVSTHDLPTIKGWWSGADIAEKRALGVLTPAQADAEVGVRTADRELLSAAINQRLNDRQPPVDPGKAADAMTVAAIHEYVGASPSALLLVQADDLAEEIAAQNLPTTDRERPNWRRKVPVDASALWQTAAGRASVAACAARAAHEPEH